MIGKNLTALAVASIFPWILAAMDTEPPQPDSAHAGQVMDDLLTGRFQWMISQPLVAPVERPEDPCYSVKDPSVVFYQGRWHLFCTIRSQNRTQP